MRVSVLAETAHVSGDAIATGVLGLRWGELSFTLETVQTELVPKDVDPIRRLAGETINASPVISGLFLPGTISDKIQSAYRTHLFGDPTVPDLPDDRPRIVIYFIATRFNPDHSVGIHL